MEETHKIGDDLPRIDLLLAKFGIIMRELSKS